MSCGTSLRRFAFDSLELVIFDCLQVQQRWPDSPLLWLRDVAQYLNFALVTNQQEEHCKEVLGGEPLSALTANMRKVIGAMLTRCEEGMRETFFETCVANTAHELAKGGNVAGWRCLTQVEIFCLFGQDSTVRLESNTPCILCSCWQISSLLLSQLIFPDMWS